MDNYRIDSHKLMYHPDRLAAWQDGENIYPLYIEISPAGSCNHRCSYCALDFMKYQPRFLKTDIFLERLTELGAKGVKSIMFAGEGEPFLHKDMAAFVDRAAESGIDVAFTTNGTLMTRELSLRVLPKARWIKVSVNGATKETYTKIHRAPAEDFDKLLRNLKDAVEVRRKLRSACTLGLQLLLLPENHHEAVALARLAKDIGLDYLVIKPYSQHPQSRAREYSRINYGDYLFLRDELVKESTKDFEVIFRLKAMQKLGQDQKAYKTCIALPFWTYIDAGGNVWGCSMFLNDERFLYGNIMDQAFERIWEGKKRADSLTWVQDKMDASHCRLNCRMDEVNRYLWELKTPPAHVNFV